MSLTPCKRFHPTQTNFLMLPVWKILEKNIGLSIGSPTSCSWRAYTNSIIPWADFKNNPARSAISILVQFLSLFFFSLIIPCLLNAGLFSFSRCFTLRPQAWALFSSWLEPPADWIILLPCRVGGGWLSSTPPALGQRTFWVRPRPAPAFSS